jgi:hypothetical protein
VRDRVLAADPSLAGLVGDADCIHSASCCVMLR